MIAAGNANKEIADQFSITKDTVKGRVESVLAKLDGSDRTHAAVGAGAGLGAIIGAIADGDDGAAIGAVVGGITGTIVAASGEEHLTLPAETRLQFELTAAVRVEP